MKSDPATSVPAAEESEPGSLFRGKGLFWWPLAPLIALDLWSKSAAFAFVTERHLDRFSRYNDVPVFDWGFIQLEWVTWLNRGTIWGLGSEYHAYLKYLRLGAIALILYFVFRVPARSRWMLIALSLILAGALGNMYDNFIHFHGDYSNIPGQSGAVRDFIHFFQPKDGESSWYHWDFPAFNVADSCITVGAAALFVQIWRNPDGLSGASGSKS